LGRSGGLLGFFGAFAFGSSLNVPLELLFSDFQPDFVFFECLFVLGVPPAFDFLQRLKGCV
jgi:hypothetical protein